MCSMCVIFIIVVFKLLLPVPTIKLHLFLITLFENVIIFSLSKELKIAKTNIQILKGQTGKDKTLLFKVANEETKQRIKKMLL